MNPYDNSLRHLRASAGIRHNLAHGCRHVAAQIASEMDALSHAENFNGNTDAPIEKGSNAHVNPTMAAVLGSALSAMDKARAIEAQLNSQIDAQAEARRKFVEGEL